MNKDFFIENNKLWCESTTNPVPMLRIAASRGFSGLTQNWIRSFHGHSAPSLKISCKSVQPFSRNLANKETNKQRKKDINKERNRSKTIPRPPIYRGRGNYLLCPTLNGKTIWWYVYSHNGVNNCIQRVGEKRLITDACQANCLDHWVQLFSTLQQLRSIRRQTGADRSFPVTGCRLVRPTVHRRGPIWPQHMIVLGLMSFWDAANATDIALIAFPRSLTFSLKLTNLCSDEYSTMNPTSFTSSYLRKLTVLITCTHVNIIDSN